ncbi:MAG: hypothetical protein WAU60_14705 [Candidatus Competibacter denitrificans]
MKGHKRFTACDIKGNLLDSLVLPANADERVRVLLGQLKTSPLDHAMALIRADEGFVGADWEAQINDPFDWPVGIILKPKAQVSFAVLPPAGSLNRPSAAGNVIAV